MISVIVPAFNAYKTIGETIESIQQQTLLPGEIIVVDDGSTDDTGRHPALSAPIVKVHRQNHAGAPAALNRGVSRGAG